MTQEHSEQSYSQAAATGRRARSAFIQLTHELPEPTSDRVLRLWNVADQALLDFLRAMDDDEVRQQREEHR